MRSFARYKCCCWRDDFGDDNDALDSAGLVLVRGDLVTVLDDPDDNAVWEERGDDWGYGDIRYCCRSCFVEMGIDMAMGVCVDGWRPAGRDDADADTCDDVDWGDNDWGWDWDDDVGG